MESLLLFRRALASPTMCRFIPALSVHETPGHAAIALVLLRDRGQFATQTIHPLGEPIPPSQGESPFPLDFYLSWMSPKVPKMCKQLLCCDNSWSRIRSL